MEKEEEPGLSTRDALHKLYREIEMVLHQFKSSQKTRTFKRKNWIRTTIRPSHRYSTIHYINLFFEIWAILGLFIAFVFSGDSTFLATSIILIILLSLNLALELYESKLRYNEIPNRVKSVLETIGKESEIINWNSNNYPNLCSPISPCITLQWTYRDNKLVNLPWSLLVKDDIILIRPGQASPGYSEALDKHSEYPLLHAREIYSPTLQNANEIFSAPKARRPLENKKYKLLETPFLNNLRLFLEQALDKPVTQLNQQRYLLMTQFIEKFVLPFIFFAVVIFTLFRYFFVNLNLDDLVLNLLLIPITVTLPLLPVVFPVAWNILNYMGIAKFNVILNSTRDYNKQINPLEEDTDTTTVDFVEAKFSLSDVWQNFLMVLKGRPEILCRSANILHTLGSVTALGCVDKKGILSWPNPNAEKVFFLHNKDNVSPSSSLGNVNDLTADGDSGEGGTPYHTSYDQPNVATAEVLDLTHNHSDPFKLHFDDPEWHRHIASLKPLGLAILLNTCNIDTQEHYTGFCSHITCESVYNENLVPISNRRCLCELAKEIGFIDQAQKIFALEQKLSTFRHLQTEMVRRDNKYARSLQLSTKLKFPFPHMFAVVVKELSSGSMQLLSEGTADIILDSCVDYWDGHDLCPLSTADRKKIQDFYQRSSLTAYCTAFAYRPLNKGFNNKLSDVYLELPSDSRHLYMNYRSPTPVHWDCKSVLEPKIRNALGQFYSTDSLLYDCPSSDVSDAESCFHMQCNQVFIGMVTMQYQVLTDMVQLIEQLERACVRFVHFSKENELRSRVFSEKMGLESGWNCHISLLSERNRPDSGQKMGLTRPEKRRRRLSQSARKLTAEHHSDDDDDYNNESHLESSRAMSFSAPSAINMEHSIVKFDPEEVIKSVSDQSDVFKSNDSVIQIQEINSTSHDWQSLSCLTDSTEHSVPINFDMSNRAKLPRGIDKIRPHIELIDNVPLLVSLFTDCTSTAIREMLNIMQDYGEIVCILGSSANCDNAGIFMQADSAVAIDPLYPQVCQKLKAYEQTQNCISPIDLASKVNSIVCSLNMKREQPISFYHLIMESRHFVTILWNAVQFWACCCVVLSLIQLFTTISMLPLIFSPIATLWLICIVIPLLSISLIALELDHDLTKEPKCRNIVNFNWELFIFILWCYGGKLLPTIIVTMTTYSSILSDHCDVLCQLKNCTCDLFYIESGIWNDGDSTLQAARLIAIFIVLLHFVVISAGFVHRNYLIYKKLPTNNKFWLITVFILVLIQSLYTIVSFLSFDQVLTIPIWVIVFAAVSPCFVLFINELIKQQEIRVNKRYQKRARLDFGTKLGMNSPF